MTPLMLLVAFINIAVIAYLIRFSGRLRGSASRLIAVPPAEVYARLADFEQWDAWNPWLEHQPGATVSRSTPATGVGATCHWQGQEAGASSLELLHQIPGELLEQRLSGHDPLQYQVKLRWTLVERDGQTEVTVAFSGRVPLAQRIYARTIQGMLGLDLRYGLNRLARLLEPANASHYAIEHLGIRNVAAQQYAYQTYSGAISGVASAVQKGLAEVRSQLAKLKLAPAGPALCVYARTSVKSRSTVCHMGYPLALPEGETAPSALATRKFPAHQAYALRLTGPYSALEVAWYLAMQRMRTENLHMDQAIPPFERYLNEAGSVPEAEQVTELYIAVLPPRE